MDVRVDGGEDQALEFVRLQRLHFPLDRALDVEAVAAGEGRPPRVAALAFGRRESVRAHLLVGEQHPGHRAPAARALYPVPLEVPAGAVEVADHCKVGFALLVGDAVADDVGIWTGS
ncbi:hypothetical protein ACFWUZ_17475 [Streptomyces sp. NPDC058646]|uniref:hypothetical protein n=1 Tax=Streptomyces sp. NPDC058646 TaxID=3346574 RepID=UPI003648A31F